MNHSEFWVVVSDTFGSAYGQAIVRTLALPQLGHRTATELLDSGEKPQKVWSAICHEMDLDDETEFRHRQNRKHK
ncbi:DUF3046 domain-containing protein [Flaviflexus massiliensis]|uniref:DUF3046 domain-containing protein n=1 Tax=Flaviflexus massiliensis TaxID=1522309 RepID=UPI0006D53D71